VVVSIVDLGFLTKVVNELEDVVCSLDESKPRRDNEALVAKFFRALRHVEGMVGDECKDVKAFPKLFDMANMLNCFDAFILDWDSGLKSFVVRWDEGARIRFLKNALQALIWGLVGKALKYMPAGEEALAQAYEDILNGLGDYTDTDTLEILHQLGLDRAKAYREYMSVKEKYKNQVRDLKRLDGLRQILSLVSAGEFSYATRVKVNDWWSKTRMFSQLDTRLTEEFDSLAFHLVSLNTLVKVEKLYRKKGLNDVQNLLSNGGSELNGYALMETYVRTHALSSLVGEGAVQRLKADPALVHPLKRQVESSITRRLQNLSAHIEERLEGCSATGERNVKRKTKDPPYIVLYHTFFSPIIWDGGKEKSREKARLTADVPVQEMLKEIEAFNPDRYKDLPLWWAKKKYEEKISEADEMQRERLIKLFYELIKGGLSIKKYHEEMRLTFTCGRLLNEGSGAEGKRQS